MDAQHALFIDDQGIQWLLLILHSIFYLMTRLVSTREARMHSREQYARFFSSRRTIEYGIKGTITASMAIGLLFGGPPTWIIGGAALMLFITTNVLNRHTISQYEEHNHNLMYTSSHDHGHDNEDANLSIRQKWHRDFINDRFVQQRQHLFFLQRRTAAALIVGFTLFTTFSAALTLPIVLSGLLYATSFVYKTKEPYFPYIESEQAAQLPTNNP
jgi:hypothetical protein